MSTNTSTSIRSLRSVSGPWGSTFVVSTHTVVANVATRIKGALRLDDAESFEDAFSTIAHLDIPAYYASLDTADRWGSINEFWAWVVVEQPLTDGEVAHVRQVLAVRLGAIEGRFDMDGVWRDCSNIALFSSFEETLANIERTYR